MMKRKFNSNFKDQPIENQELVLAQKDLEKGLAAVFTEKPKDTYENAAEMMKSFLETEKGREVISEVISQAERYSVSIDGQKLTRTYLTEEEAKYLYVYTETLSRDQAIAASGINKARLNSKLASNTMFGVMFRSFVKNISKHPKLTKNSAIDKLLFLQSKAEDNGDFKLSLAIQKELNKMLEGHIAPNQTHVHNTTEKTIEVIDLTEKEK